MSAADRTAKGRCLCGAVRFEAVGIEEAVSVCHCGTCRRWNSGPMMAVHPERGVSFQAQDTLVWYRSSGWAERGFCGACGSSLFYRLVDKPDFVAVSAGALEVAFSGLENHIFVDEKPAYYDFADDSPRLTGAEVIAMFSGGEQDA